MSLDARIPILLAVLALAACDREPPQRPEAIRPVRVVVVEAQASHRLLSYPGEVRPRIESRYGFRVGGKLSQRLVSVGDKVKPGQLLARLDPQDVAPAIAAQQAQVQASQTDLTLAELELRRLRELRAQNYISQGQLDRQQAVAESAASRLAAARAQLASARNSSNFQRLEADVAGVVTAVDAEVGQVVSQGQSVVRIAQTAETEILVNVPEPEVGRVRTIRDWSVVVPALGEQRLPARLREISPLADPQSRTYPMRLALSGPIDGVSLGMTAIAQAEQANEPGFVLPLSALYSKDQSTHVWRVDRASGTVQPVAVRTGGLLDESVRITEGIQAGDTIVTAGANLLVAGQKVRLPDDSVQVSGGGQAPGAATVSRP